MRFKDLYDEAVAQVQEPPVRFELLKALINQRHHGVGEIEVRAISYPVQNHQAHFVTLGEDRTSAYDEEFTVAEIRYCDGVDEHPNERRFALTKELMHVFDTEEEKTNTRARFVQLMSEIQNTPLPQHASAMYLSEIATKWMAAVILCPKHIRQPLLDPYREGTMKEAEIAAKLQIPRSFIPDIMDDYYNRAFDTLMAK
ncbi:MAG: hypothetical protein EOR99_28080 [Mesorhizobium sp.]|uniref:hypothetical protein n=1 Tax=Mesorhizobium sp. TaxID=1871066 RepID=UPI000FE891F7|nr:hypothetical protein [Mesorhizobium sp.]RWM76903.1 MAG: hypothetical protein EOR81_20930 [Mesorhizobium sp.]RWN53613.1 MAG: hypothetical protein EOS00_30660 [Mesorhizobium sp.]RWN62896.1 MAG: hypothetical protein EOR99_28080 [Mesorhizobium sp.]TIR30442.1 MAG: hypothetical protein E5X35_22520 [Mesorhizobium sp.]TIY11735.1 MAG: hypothetical protein E5V16_03590 [Mesorhizobium sp.]